MPVITINVLLQCDNSKTAKEYSQILSGYTFRKFETIAVEAPLTIDHIISTRPIHCIIVDSENEKHIDTILSTPVISGIPVIILSSSRDMEHRYTGTIPVSYIPRAELTPSLFILSVLYAIDTQHAGITQRRVATQKREEEYRQLRLAVEHSPATVVITDTEGNIEYVNPKFSNLTGYSFDEALGNNPRILKSGEQPKSFYRDMWATISSGREWKGEFHNKKKNGDMYWESASISPVLDNTGAVTHYVAVKEDITARKAAEDALRISEEQLRARNLQMEKDMKIAQVAQKGLIPVTPPNDPAFAIACRYSPLEKVGGDYFAFFHHAPGIMGLFMCDVSGHGVAAALFTALLKSTAESAFREFGEKPAEYIAALNRELKDHLSTYFITGIYGLLRSSPDGSATFTYANGAHPLPVLYKNDGTASLAGKSNTIIGILDNPGYDEQEITIERGDRIFFYTDGIPETENENKEIIDFDTSLLAMFSRAQKTTLQETLDNILGEVNAFRGTAPLGDDISIIGIEIQ